MEGNGRWLSSVSRQDWSFDRRGAKDEARHNEKVKESIKDNLGEVVSDGSIITADPKSKKAVKIPLKSLELPRFKFGDNQGGVGTGDGNGEKRPGDEVGDQPGEGPEAGDKPGEEYYEAELSIEEIQAMVFADLGLPNMQERGADNVVSEEVRFDDIRKKRTTNNMDIGRTAMQNIMRNAQSGLGPVLHNISQDDYRVRTWEEEMKPKDSAVVFAMADISGSMGEFEKYVTKTFCWWTKCFLETKYPSVDIVFIAHDTEAYEVTEEQFFTRGAGGGTKCSSANRMALDIMNERYPTSQYNVYPLHFSDGDNWGDDDNTCLNLVNEMLEKNVNQYAYVQINSRNQGESKLYRSYQNNLKDDRYNGIIIDKKEGVLEGLKQIFKQDLQ